MTPRQRAAARAATWAAVLEHFSGLRPADLADMTDFQIHGLYLHARDKDGRVKVPRAGPPPARKPLTEEEAVRKYLRIAAKANRGRPGAFPPEVIERQVAQIRAHHRGKRDDARGQRGPGPQP